MSAGAAVAAGADADADAGADADPAADADAVADANADSDADAVADTDGADAVDTDATGAASVLPQPRSRTPRIHPSRDSIRVTHSGSHRNARSASR